MRTSYFVIVTTLMIATPIVAEDHLAVIERSLDEQYSSIHSTEVRFRHIYKVPIAGAVPRECLDNAVEWEWLISDRKRLVKSEPRGLQDQLVSNWYSFDGQKAYQAYCWRTDGTRFHTIRWTRSLVPGYWVNAAPERMLGLHWQRV